MQYLRRLEDLILPFNAKLIDTASLDGILPLSLLKHLELQYCGMEGTLPDDIGNLQALTFLGLGKCFYFPIYSIRFNSIHSFSICQDVHTHPHPHPHTRRVLLPTV
jgi:hypothetical protein